MIKIHWKKQNKNKNKTQQSKNSLSINLKSIELVPKGKSMQKVKKNLSAIERKFQSLKQFYKNDQEPTKIGQIAEIMTYGVVDQKQVNQYLQSLKNEGKNDINDNWLELSIQQMILFFDQVIKHRKLKKHSEGAKKQRLKIVSWQKIKTKMSNKEAHQNPFIPRRIGVSIQNTNSGDSLFLVGDSQSNELSKIDENKDKQDNSGLQQQEFRQIMDVMNYGESLSFLKIRSKTQQDELLSSEFPADFTQYSPQKRFTFLRTSYNNKKNLLQKKFNMIYTHYKKEMYIPKETFDVNEELMLDLKMFLRYYREFQISQRFKTNLASNHFKKLAINGIWLDFQNFTKIHYILAQIIKIDEPQIKKMTDSQINTQNIQENRDSYEIKKLLSKNIKLIMQNLLKLKQLTDLISEEKINRLLNVKSGKSFIKKIVEVHSGLVKEDIMFRLKQRIEQKRKKNEQSGNKRLSSVKLISTRSEKTSSFKDLYQSIKPNPSYRSIYQQLLIPNLSPAEMKQSSIYSSLQLLNIHKEKEKLRQLIIQDDNQKYLQAFFKKQKLLNSLLKSHSPLKRQNYDLHNQLTLPERQNKSIISARKIKNSLSLPRMKFS